MRNSSQFPGGIVNGYDWYEVNGGMQDWSYYWHNDLQFTVELSNRKWPDYSMVARYYQDNKTSLVNFLETIHQGAGIIISSGELGGKVSIRNEDSNQDLGTYPYTTNEFYKVLPEGNYIFSIKTLSNKTYTKSVVVNSDNTTNNGNFYAIK